MVVAWREIGAVGRVVKNFSAKFYLLCVIFSGSPDLTLKTCLVDEHGALLGYYAASGGCFVPKFRDNLSVPSSSAVLIAGIV